MEYEDSSYTILPPPMVPLFEASKRVILATSSFSLPELLHCLGRSKVDRAEEILSELRKHGYLEVGGDCWWKVEVLTVMMSECLDGEMGHIRIQRILASESLAIYKIHVERGEEDHQSKSASFQSHQRLRCALSLTDVAAVTSAATPSTQIQPGNTALESTFGEVAADAPLRPHNALGYLIAKHPETMSSVSESTVLVTVGGIACLPGFANCFADTILAHPAVTFAGGVTFSVGNWLKVVVKSATANGERRAQSD